MGGAYVVLLVLLQELLGRRRPGQPAVAGVLGRTARHPGRRPEGVCLQAVLQESHVFLPGGKRTHLPAVSLELGNLLRSSNSNRFFNFQMAGGAPECHPDAGSEADHRQQSSH